MAYSVSWNNPYAAQNVPQGYQPKSHYNYVKEVGQVLKGQTDKIMAIWYNREYSNGDAVYMEDGEKLFRNIFESRSGLVPEFLSLFSDENLRPIPDNIWYELANSHLSRGQVDAVRKELLRQHAPPPQLATREAVDYFHQRVGGQPRQNPPSQAEVTASQHPHKAYRPKHPMTNIDEIAGVLRGQMDKIKAVWHNRGHTNKGPFTLYDDRDPGKGVFGNFVNCYCGLLPDFLALFSDTTLRPLPDDIWYELANYALEHFSNPAKMELLRQNAPYPHLASTQAVNFFYQKVGGQPPQAPSKSKLEAFSEKVNPAPQQGMVMRSAHLKQEDPAAAQQPANLPVRQVAPAAADNQAERELQAMREAFRQLQAASEKDRAEKERLQRELEQEKQAKPAAAQAKPAAQAQPAQNEKYLCSICMDREFTVFYDPCGHKICKPCVDDWKKQKNGELNCPNCRQTATKVTNLFD